MKMRSYYLGELAWPDVESFLAQHHTVVIPVGSCEQHGPHLPIDTDAFDAFWLSKKAAEKAKCALVAPPINYGVSMHHMDFPGTVTLSPQTLEQLAYEVAVSLIRHGFRKIVFENAHGGNTPALLAAAQRIKAEKPEVFVVVDSVDLIPDYIEKEIETVYDAHSGEFETSTTLANREEWVVKERVSKPEIRFPRCKYTKIGLKEHGPKVSWVFRTRELSPTGVIGDPTKASKEKGEKAWQLAVERLADLLVELDEM
ncbi:MAG TPA: creatininase family protein [Candidatus Bathyarchaeota archaeon]|nr:creatininase family protein [Candidatus Bathyarchaeota archaeon]